MKKSVIGCRVRQSLWMPRLPFLARLEGKVAIDRTEPRKFRVYQW